MKRLISKGLMFGNLIEVSSPVLVDRYNRALKSLTGKQTKLTDFHIDISGYSPEIGDELGDPMYLNHAGVNRQFILLTTDQKTAPLLHAKFSTSRDILKQFMQDNDAQLFALTAQDAVAGELVNSVYDVSDPASLFAIRKIEIEADTTDGAVQKTEDLTGMINRFKREPNAWFDDVLIADMIETAKTTGDVLRNPIKLKKRVFEQGNFWSAHFGGLYVFRDVEHPAMISMVVGRHLENAPMEYQFDAQDRSRIAQFLELNDLVEPIVKAKGIKSASILRQKMDFIVVDVAADAGEPLGNLTRRDIRSLTRKYKDALPDEYHGLDALVRWAEAGGRWPRITSDHPAYFYTLRAADHKDADLVNMLLSELAPKDARQLFICHKEAFYDAYAQWPESKKEFVADFLSREYLVDKVGAREALFGHEADTDDPTHVREQVINRVGPWGAIRR